MNSRRKVITLILYICLILVFVIGLYFNNKKQDYLYVDNVNNESNIKAINILLNSNIGGLKVLDSILSYLEFNKTTYSAIPNDLIEAYNGKTYLIDGDKMENIILMQIEDGLRQLKRNKEV